MNSKRFKFQMYIEGIVGCSDIEKWGSYKQKFLDYSLSEEEVLEASRLLMVDAADLYYKCCFSLVKAINSIHHGYHSWAVVKLYYAVFYGMRAELAAQNIGFVKNNGIYTWRLERGQKAKKADGKNVRGDHGTTIKAFKDIVGENDVLQTNSIEERCVYDWLMEKRNDINYRDRTFFEPEPDNFYGELFDCDKLETTISSYLEDDVPIYCFDTEHCMLAAPIRRFVSLKRAFVSKGIADPLEGRKESILKLIEPIASTNSSKMYYFSEYNRS